MKIDLIGLFGKFYSHFPDLGSELKDLLLKIFPVATLVAGILLTLASVIELLGTPFISVFTLTHGGPKLIQILLITSAIGVFQGILMIYAYPFLRRKKERGWRLLFWTQVLWLVSSVLSLSPSIIVSLLLFYFIFQVKQDYK